MIISIRFSFGVPADMHRCILFLKSKFYEKIGGDLSLDAIDATARAKEK